jgi:3-hydroxymyristoyl/3-hydroxydecanoyl-(acyl carrier protein) dehydratase
MGDQDLLTLLPHGHPMRLVDRVIGVRAGIDVETTSMVSGREPCYAAGAGPYPAVLLLEALVQSAALLWLADVGASGGAGSAGSAGLASSLLDPGGAGSAGSAGLASSLLDPGGLVLAAVRGARFGARARPGDVLRHRARLVSATAGRALLSGSTVRAGLAEPLLEVREILLVRRRGGAP